MYLKEIENRPAEGMTKVAFMKLREDGEAIPEILHLFRFKRRSTDHLVRFTEEVMRGPSPLSPGMRELIGAFFSRRNQCLFCSDAHSAAAAEYLGQELVNEVLFDLENSRLDSAHKELFRYIGKLADNAAGVGAADIDKLKEMGWSEEAIYDALTVASVFQFYNTWNGGSGVQNMTSADYVHTGKVLTTMGYCMDFKLGRLVKIAANRLGAMARAVFQAGPQQRPRTQPAVAETKSAPANAGLRCDALIFTPVEKTSFRKKASGTR